MDKITAAESFEAEVVWLGLPRRNTVAVSIEMDRPVLSRTLHGFLLPRRAVRSFLNVGAAAACKVAAEDALDCLTTGGVSRHKVKCSVKNMFKKGAYWGAAAGAFEAIEYGVELIRGRSDWKNAMIGGAIAGALISAANSTHRGNRVIKDAIAGGAIGTAVEFISHRRHVVFGPIRLDDADETDQMWELPRNNANKNGQTMGIQRRERLDQWDVGQRTDVSYTTVAFLMIGQAGPARPDLYKTGSTSKSTRSRHNKIKL